MSCMHLDEVTLPDGTVVWAASFYGVEEPYRREVVPDHGLYLDACWQPPWPHDRVDWPDFGVPADPDALRAALVDVLARSRRGERVELGCIGGHGRTGTALACLATLTGIDPGRAVAWTRAAYCHRAVETEVQQAFVAGFRPEG